MIGREKEAQPVLPLKNIFNRIFWDSRVSKMDYVITYIHRGAPSDERTIPAAMVKQVGRSRFTYEEQGQDVMIPMHRVIVLMNMKTGEVLWRKRIYQKRNS